MIASCLERMWQEGCGGCERKEACARMFRSLRFDSPPRRRRERGEPRPALSANPFLAILGEIARTIEARMKPPASAFRREVEKRVEPLLASGRVRVERVARDLGCSRQTLYRRLKAEGTTFEQLLDSLRRRLALKFLSDEGL